MDILKKRSILPISALVLLLTLNVVSVTSLAQNQMPDPLSDADVNEIHELIDYYFLTFQREILKALEQFSAFPITCQAMN